MRRVLTLMGVVCLGGAALLTLPLISSVQEALKTAEITPVNLAFSAEYDRPLLFLSSGGVLFPSDNGIWQSVPLPEGETALVDVYAEPNGTLWFVGAHGLYQWFDGQWTQIDGVPGASEIEAMHGFTFVFTDQGVYRGPDDWRQLNLPEPDTPAAGLAMLADHTHVILQGDRDLLRTNDMGLSWEIIEAPQPVSLISADLEGNLLVVTDTGLQRWRWQTEHWSEVAPLPDEQTITHLQYFLDQLYALTADNQLYLLDGDTWVKQTITTTVASGINVTAMARRRLSELWVLETDTDTEANRLWFTLDGTAWSAVEISIDE